MQFNQFSAVKFENFQKLSEKDTNFKKTEKKIKLKFP